MDKFSGIEFLELSAWAKEPQDYVEPFEKRQKPYEQLVFIDVRKFKGIINIHCFIVHFSSTTILSDLIQKYDEVHFVNEQAIGFGIGILDSVNFKKQLKILV